MVRPRSDVLVQDPPDVDQEQLLHRRQVLTAPLRWAARVLQNLVETRVLQNLVETRVLQNLVETRVLRNLVETRVLQNLVETRVLRNLVETRVLQNLVETRVLRNLVETALTLCAISTIFPSRIPGIYSHQEFLGFIPHKGNSWDLFPLREIPGIYSRIRCDISPHKKFLVCASDFRWENFLTILPGRICVRML